MKSYFKLSLITSLFFILHACSISFGLGHACKVVSSGSFSGGVSVCLQCDSATIQARKWVNEVFRKGLPVNSGLPVY